MVGVDCVTKAGRQSMIAREPGEAFVDARAGFEFCEHRLDPIAGDTVEVACEKVLFASPEATAAAVSYVAAQLSILASAAEPCA